MERLAVIGGGISGLGIAQRIKNRFDVHVFEADACPGGLIKCNRVEGNLFHMVGGHVFNSRRQDVLDWFWAFFDRDNEFVKAARNAVVSMPDGRLILYPIENHIYQMNDQEKRGIVADLLEIAKSESLEPKNFEEFLLYRFGKTLYETYFKPYNEKIWHKDLTTVPLSWLVGKLPMPTIDEIILNNINQVEETTMVHSSFWYAKKGGSQFIANRLAEGLSIEYNACIDRIIKKDGQWLINGQLFDKIIFCGNIKDFPAMIADSLDLSEFEKPISELDYHGTTTAFCSMDTNPYSWIYMPSREHPSHRFICTGNFSPTNNTNDLTTTSLEFTDYVSKEDIISYLSKIPFSPKYITHQYTEYTYPVQNDSTREFMNELKSVLKPQGIYLVGRFAEWEYFNMDAALGSGLDLANKNNW